MKGTKFIHALVAGVLLSGVFAALLAKGKLTDTIFIAWLGAFIANVIQYSMANIAASGQASIPPKTSTASSTEPVVTTPQMQVVVGQKIP